jgi:hypothetical protein
MREKKSKLEEEKSKKECLEYRQRFGKWGKLRPIDQIIECIFVLIALIFIAIHKIKTIFKSYLVTFLKKLLKKVLKSILNLIKIYKFVHDLWDNQNKWETALRFKSSIIYAFD